MPHHTKDKGDLAVAKVIAHLMEHNIRVCRPLSEHLPFDFIAVMPDMHTLRRVQVKYRSDNGYGAVKVPFKSNYYDSKRIYTKPVNLDHIDCYAIYNAPKQEIYYVRVDELPPGAKVLTLRYEPAKNGQAKHVWDAKLYTDPRRIAPSLELVVSTSRVSSEKDDLALAKVTEDLMAQGYYVCQSTSQFISFDLVALFPDMKTMFRVRVGCDMANRCDVVDAYAIWNEDTARIHYLHGQELQPGENTVTLHSHLHVKSVLEAQVMG